MTLLSKIRECIKAEISILTLKDSLIKEAVKCGLTWKELAFISVPDAIKLCSEQVHPEIAADKVRDYIRESGIHYCNR